MKKIRVKLVRGLAGCKRTHRDTVRGRAFMTTDGLSAEEVVRRFDGVGVPVAHRPWYVALPGPSFSKLSSPWRVSSVSNSETNRSSSSS